MNNTVGITFVCGEKGEMLTSKRPQGQFLSAFGCLPAAVRATSTLKLNDYPSHKSKPEEYFSFFGANTQNCWSRFFVGGLTLTDPMFTLSYLIKLMFEMYQDHKMTSSKLGNGMFFFSCFLILWKHIYPYKLDFLGNWQQDIQVINMWPDGKTLEPWDHSTYPIVSVIL